MFEIHQKPYLLYNPPSDSDGLSEAASPVLSAEIRAAVSFVSSREKSVGGVECAVKRCIAVTAYRGAVRGMRMHSPDGGEHYRITEVHEGPVETIFYLEELMDYA